MNAGQPGRRGKLPLVPDRKALEVYAVNIAAVAVLIAITSVFDPSYQKHGVPEIAGGSAAVMVLVLFGSYLVAGPPFYRTTRPQEPAAANRTKENA